LVHSNPINFKDTLGHQSVELGEASIAVGAQANTEISHTEGELAGGVDGGVEAGFKLRLDAEFLPHIDNLNIKLIYGGGKVESLGEVSLDYAQYTEEVKLIYEGRLWQDLETRVTYGSLSLSGPVSKTSKFDLGKFKVGAKGGASVQTTNSVDSFSVGLKGSYSLAFEAKKIDLKDGDWNTINFYTKLEPGWNFGVEVESSPGFDIKSKGDPKAKLGLTLGALLENDSGTLDVNMKFNVEGNQKTSKWSAGINMQLSWGM